MAVRLLRAFLAVSLGLAAVALPCCGPEPDPARTPPSQTAAAPPPLIIAVLPERNIFEQQKRYQHLQTHLAAALGRPVAITMLDDYQALFDEILLRRVDAAFFSSMNGAVAQLRGGVEMLARPVDLAGASTYAAVLFAAKGSGVTKDPRTWKNRRAALVSKVTTSGYLYPLSLLRQAGYRGGLEGHVAKLAYAGSHDATVLAVRDGQADFGACENTVFDDCLRRHPDLAARLTVLDVSAQVPSNALGVRPDLDPALTRALREALLGMHLREDGQQALRQFGAQRFVETGMADYAPVFAMARAAGVDLAAWSLHENR